MTYLSEQQIVKLLAPINPQRVGKDGKGFSHVEAYEVRAMMTRLFGFARWSQEVTEQEAIFETEGNGRWTVAYRSVVRVTVCSPDGTVLAVYQEGATGEAKNQPSRGDAHDLALKTSQSQAFKRAVANLGDAFGLSLYGKGSMKPLVFRTLVMPEAEETEDAPAVDAHIDAPVAAEDGSPAEDTPPADVPEQSPGPAEPDVSLAYVLAKAARDANGEKPTLTKLLLKAHREHVAQVVVTKDKLTLEQFIAAEGKRETAVAS